MKSFSLLGNVLDGLRALSEFGELVATSYHQRRSTGAVEALIISA